MTNYSLVYLLLLGWIYSVNIARSVQLGLTTSVTLAAVKHTINVRCFTAALVFIKANSFRFGLLRMLTTVSHFGDWIEFLAASAFDNSEVGPDLPVNFFPADSVGFPNKSNELFEVPVSVDNVFGTHLAVSINTELATSASEHLVLLFRK